MAALLRAEVLRASALAATIVAVIALVLREWLTLGALYPAKAAGMFAAAAACTIVYAAFHHPYGRFGPANRVTMVRLMAVAWIAGLIGEAAGARAALAAAIASGAMQALDGVDGWLARRSGMASRFGARFDMETDAALILAMSILVWQHDKAGVWVLSGGLMRYVFVLAGWRLPWLARPLRPTRRAKVITVCHAVGLSVALAPFIRVPLSSIAVGVTTAALAWSFAVDVARLRRMAEPSGSQ